MLKPIRVKYLSLYNRKYLLAFVLAVIVLSGCSKDNTPVSEPDPTPDTPENPEPIRVMQTIFTSDNQGTLHTILYHTPTTTKDALLPEMTYNDEGYPLTFKYKDKNYISTRLVYNR